VSGQYGIPDFAPAANIYVSTPRRSGVDELQQRMVNRIRELARKRGIAITHIPDRCGVGRSHFFEVMAGRASPTLEWVTKIAVVFEVDPGELLAPGAQGAGGAP